MENYIKSVILIKKIDSINDNNLISQAEKITKYEESNKQISIENKFVNSMKSLEKIDSSSYFYEQKLELIKRNDQIIIDKAINQYNDNNLDESEEYLSYISNEINVFKKKESIIKKINYKRKANKVNQKYIAKATISKIMNVRPYKIKVKIDGSRYIVSYYSNYEKKRISYKVMFAGNSVMWGNLNGRWRTHKYDSDIWYSETKSTYTIHEKWNDGSGNEEKFYKKKLK